MKNFIQRGDVIDIVAGSNLTGGVAVAVGALLAVPQTDIANGATGAAIIEGVVELPKLSTAVITAGMRLIWDVSAGQFIIASAATGDLLNCAVAVAAAGNGVATVKAKLTPDGGSISA